MYLRENYSREFVLLPAPGSAVLCVVFVRAKLFLTRICWQSRALAAFDLRLQTFLNLIVTLHPKYRFINDIFGRLEYRTMATYFS